VAAAVTQAHALQRCQGSAAALGLAHTGVQQGQLHILQGRGTRHQVELLEYKAHAPVAQRGKRIGVAVILPSFPA
jgi:hypothetical protein